MKRLLSAIASALRSTVSFVWEKCAATGKWTLRTVAAIGGSGGIFTPAAATEMQDLEAAMVDDLLKPLESQAPPSAGGDGYDRVQRVCRDLNSGHTPAPEDLAALTPTTREWLTLLEPQMRLLVGNVEKEALVAHIRGGKCLRGVIRSDAESIAQWKHTVALEAIEAEYDDEPKLAM